MKFCNKCGAQLSDNIKFCDKCGASVSEDNTQQNGFAEVYKDAFNEASQTEHTTAQASSASSASAQTSDIKAKAADIVVKYIPSKLLDSKNKLMDYIGFGCMSALALVYLVCMYLYMPDICWPIGKSAELGGVGAGAIWMFIFFIANLFPIVFALWPLKIKSFKIYSLLCAAFIFVLTLFSLICWGICEPSNIFEAMVIYPLRGSFNTQAWFSLVDCLSEAWYLKLILSLGAVFGYGVDYLIRYNK